MTEPNESREEVLLSAYLDDELSDEQADFIADRLLREPALAMQLEGLRTADDEARRLFAILDESPMPQRVLDLIQGKNNIVHFPQRGARRFLQLPVAIAASVALAAGFLASHWLRVAPDPGSATTGLYAASIEEGGQIEELLEHSPSDSVVKLADGTRATPMLTFQDRDGAYCRQLLVDGINRSAHAVACRRGGHWQLEALAFSATVDAGAPYQPASIAVPAAVSATVDGLIGVGEPLNLRQEKQAISSSWNNPDE
jgi:hypothetical protein